MIAMIWQIETASYGTAIYQKLLQDGWEPFAVTVTGKGSNPSDWEIWFRKMVEK